MTPVLIFIAVLAVQGAALTLAGNRLARDEDPTIKATSEDLTHVGQIALIAAGVASIGLLIYWRALP